SRRYPADCCDVRHVASYLCAAKIIKCLQNQWNLHPVFQYFHLFDTVLPILNRSGAIQFAKTYVPQKSQHLTKMREIPLPERVLPGEVFAKHLTKHLTIHLTIWVVGDG
ncbi:MAG: hypothetical protein IJS97_04075, partial [Prevotella sp.]|nr:hypothetical protein [Prevotella sp.]